MKKSPYYVAISHYKYKLYDTMLKGWHYIEWQVMTHTGPRMEGLYMNYPRPAQLHQYNFLGNNKAERQQIKRKRERLLKRLHDKPIEKFYLELYAMVEALDQLNT
jgi:DNA adenine methylase